MYYSYNVHIRNIEEKLFMFSTNNYERQWKKRLRKRLKNLKQSVNRVKSEKIRKAKQAQITMISKFLNK